jgi:uncharacterized protein YoxC
MKERRKPAPNRPVEWPDRITQSVGSTGSIIVHTLLFATAFALPFFGVDLDRVLLVLTTIVSLEAIYLSLFIQMSVNRNTQSLAVVEDEIDEITEDVAEIQEDLDEIAEDVDEIAEDVDEIAEDVEEITEDIEEITEDIEEIAEDVDELNEEDGESTSAPSDAPKQA